jgi:RNA polymerase sigma-70 factor (ECF subfamily)
VNDEALLTRALIEHEDFVRSLARSLVRDEHAADDLSQDTWLAFLNRPPAPGSLRGWLATVTRNHARNAARESARRARREERVARSEVDDSESALRERLALQQRIVAAVMSLKEPYRGVILLAYHEGLSAADIARRRDVPAGTVRAQVSRGLAMMRESLDREQGGDRAAWSAGLFSWIAQAKPSEPVASVLLLTGALVLVPALGLGAWLMNESKPEPMALTAADGGARAEPLHFDALADAQDSSTRRPASASQQPGDDFEAFLRNASLTELKQFAQQMQVVLRERYLTLDAALLAARPDLVEIGARTTRLWQAGALGARMNNRIGLQGAGAFLSFVDGSQDFEHSPDLMFDGSFFAGFYRATVGHIASAGPSQLSKAGRVKPAAIDAEAWQVLWDPSDASVQSIPDSFRSRLHALKRGRDGGVTPAVGHVCFVRSIAPGEHDLLAAFEVLAKDENSTTIAWKVLERFEIPVRTNPVVERETLMPVPSAEMTALSTEALEARYEMLARVAEERILAVPATLDPALERYRSQPDGGLARIAERGMWSAVLRVDGAGAYWSFTERSHDYHGGLRDGAQLQLEQGRFSSGSPGRDVGYVVGLGPIPLDAISVRGVFGLDPALQKEVDSVLGLELAHSKDSSLGATTSEPERTFPFQKHRVAAAKLGDSYLVRSVLPGCPEVLVAFQVVDRDEAALTIAWKILRQAPAPR